MASVIAAGFRQRSELDPASRRCHVEVVTVLVDEHRRENHPARDFDDRGNLRGGKRGALRQRNGGRLAGLRRAAGVRAQARRETPA